MQREIPMNQDTGISQSHHQQSTATNSNPFDGLLLIAAGINPNNRHQVQINVIHQGKAWLIRDCNPREARTWLGEDAERLVRWDPFFIKDDGLSGIYRKPSFHTPAWVIHWDEIKNLDTVKAREKLSAILGEALEETL